MSVTNFEALSYMNDSDELLFISELDKTEAYILGFLEGFNRRTMKRWQQKGLANYN